MTIVTRSESAQFATKLTYDHEGNIVQRDTTARQAIIWSKAIKIGYQVSERNDRDRWEIVRNFACAKKGNGKNGSGKLIWKFLWRIEDNSMLSYEYFPLLQKEFNRVLSMLQCFALSATHIKFVCSHFLNSNRSQLICTQGGTASMDEVSTFVVENKLEIICLKRLVGL